MTVTEARETMKKAFLDDPDFRHGYVANVACLIMGRVPGYRKTPAKRNDLADAIIRLIFE